MTIAQLRDGLHFASRLTTARLGNAAKVYGSYFYSRLVKRPVQWGVPISLSVEPTTSCNLRCPECPSGLRSFTRPTGMLEKGTLELLINEIGHRLTYLILYFQGEPYLNKSFFDCVKIATNKGIYVATSTNAHYLTEENCRKTIESGLSRLIVSIDGTTQEVYQQYRIGGQLSKVLEGVERMTAMKRELKSQTPHIIFQFLVVKPNEHQIEEVKQLGKKLGVDEVKLKTAQVYEYENGNPLIQTIDKYARYRQTSSGKWVHKAADRDGVERYPAHCWKLWQGAVMTWDGTIVPCCFDKDAEYKMGSVLETSFQKLWQGEKYQRFRATLLKGRDENEMCKNCSEGTSVWA